MGDDKRTETNEVNQTLLLTSLNMQQAYDSPVFGLPISLHFIRSRIKELELIKRKTESEFLKDCCDIFISDSIVQVIRTRNNQNHVWIPLFLKKKVFTVLHFLISF